MVTIVTRAQWGARPPRRRLIQPLPSPRLWLHHTASEQHRAAGVREIQNDHLARGFDDIAYSHLVDDDGTIFEGRGVGVVHGNSDGSHSHAICAMGNFDVRTPPSALVDSIVELTRHGMRSGWWSNLTGGHRDIPDVDPTACPGRHLHSLIPSIRQRAGEDEPQPRRRHMSLVVQKEGTAAFYIVDGGVRIQLSNSNDISQSLAACGQEAVAVLAATTIDRIPIAMQGHHATVPDFTYVRPHAAEALNVNVVDAPPVDVGDITVSVDPAAVAAGVKQAWRDGTD